MYIWCAWQTTTRFASDQAICALAHATRSNSNFHELSLFSTDLKDEGALALLLALESNPNVRFADPQRPAGANQRGERGSCILFLFFVLASFGVVRVMARLDKRRCVC